ALLGDIIAEDLVKNGWAGALIYGHVRDKAVLAGLPLAVKALGVSPRKSVKRDEGQIGEVVTFAGQTIRSGDQLYADADGVI
ncbi:putative 4-hydroxy-4-methyl-2-oxoglutarate aldolase, partial [Acetobacter fabarum]